MKNLLCVILATIMIVCSIPFAALAETIFQDTEDNISEEEYIYYSDLFYGYSSYLTQNTYLTGLESNTTNVTTNILNEYITTSHFKASVVFEGIGIAVDPTSVAKYVSDNIGLSNFKFNDELDKANQKFVEELCNVNLYASKEVGAENKYIKNINKFLGVVEKIDKVVIEDEAYYKDLGKPELYDYFIDRAIAVLEEYCTELEPKLPSLKSELYTTLSETTEVLGDLTDTVDFTKSLALSITMQETQMELIRDIINTQSSSSTLYKGMTRLQKQLSGGLVTYFISTYIEDKVYDKIIGYLPKLTSDAILGGWKSYGSAVTAVVGLVNNIVFKGWLGYDYSEYTSAVMLTQYASDLYNGIRNKASVFSSQFGNDEIKKYETLYNAYITMKAAAFEECKNIARHNSIYELEYMDRVSDYFDIENAYQEYIEGVKTFIKAVPKENRTTNIFDKLIINNDTNLCSGSDTVIENTFYSLKNSLVCEDIEIKAKFIINENCAFQVKGDVELKLGKYTSGSGYTVTQFINKGNCIIDGNLTIQTYSYVSMTNEGILEVKGDVTQTGNAGGDVYMSNEDSVFYIGGDLTVGVASRWHVTGGTVVLNGLEQQSIKNVSIYNMHVQNSKGIKFESDISVYGTLNMNSYAIESNGYCLNVFSNAFLSEKTVYPKIVVTESFTINNEVECKALEVKGALTVAPDGALVVKEDVDLELGKYTQGIFTSLINKGNCTIDGNLTIQTYSYVSMTNEGILEVKGDVTQTGNAGGDVYMSNEDSVFYIGGDLTVGVASRWHVTGGTVVLNGLQEQRVDVVYGNKKLIFPNLYLESKSDNEISFLTEIDVSVLFNHNRNDYVLYNGGTFPDFDGDGIQDNNDPIPTEKESEHFKFKGASLSLQHNLAINYKVDKSLFDTVGYTNPYVVFEIGDKKTTVKAYAVEGDRCVFRFRNIAPNQMNDTIYATLYATYNGVEYASETKEYIVAEYCYSTLNKYAADDYAELRTLLVDLLHYGAQSQLYTKYNVDNLVNANLTETQLAWGTAEEPTLTNSLNTAYETVENPLITWKGASLNLNDSVSMRFKFITEDIDGLSLKITSDTNEWNITANNFVLEYGVYSVRFSGLNAGQMSEKVYLTMYKDGVAVSNTVCYSIESYAYSKQDSTIEHLSDLVKAMMKYGNSAHSYVN